MRFDVTTDASPGQVLQALTDFTERRPRIWHRTLDPKTYELRELGSTWAVARESTAGSPFWVVERYDWSDPSVVRWADVETSWGGLGSGEVRIVPLDGGGSRIEARWTNGGATRHARQGVALAAPPRADASRHRADVAKDAGRLRAGLTPDGLAGSGKR